MSTTTVSKAEKDLMGRTFRNACFSWERRSEREFDLEVSGVMAQALPAVTVNGVRHPAHTMNVRFSAWLPLAAIRELTTWPALAADSDYPEMVREGDWSGIRDSETDTIWRMFHRHVLKEK